MTLGPVGGEYSVLIPLLWVVIAISRMSRCHLIQTGVASSGK
jgi:hypothetical protein